MKVKSTKNINTCSIFIDSIGSNFENRFQLDLIVKIHTVQKIFFTLITRFGIQLHVQIIKLAHTNQKMAKNGPKMDIRFLFTFPIIFFCETKFVKSDTVHMGQTHVAYLYR